MIVFVFVVLVVVFVIVFVFVVLVVVFVIVFVFVVLVVVFVVLVVTVGRVTDRGRTGERIPGAIDLVVTRLTVGVDPDEIGILSAVVPFVGPFHFGWTVLIVLFDGERYIVVLVQLLDYELVTVPRCLRKLSEFAAVVVVERDRIDGIGFVVVFLGCGCCSSNACDHHATDKSGRQ